MKKRALIFIGLALVVLALVSAASAQDVQPRHSADYWDATYWNNKDLSGSPALTRADANLDFNWGNGSPQSGVVNSDQFSARWTRYIYFDAGTYRFSATADDGIRLAVNGAWIINDWSDHVARTVTADVHLTAGHHLVTVEYYENAGLASAKVSWQLVTVVTEWRGEYYNNADLSGSPALVRNDAGINYDWALGAPAAGINADRFSVRWTRTLNFTAGNYTFSTTTDDGLRLWVNGHLLIDKWQIQAAQTHSNQIYLPGGNVELKMEYFENTGHATAKLAWRSGSAPEPAPPPPTGSVVIDNGSAGFVRGGRESSWRSEAEGYGGSLLWTKNNDLVRANYNWARWYPNLTPGRFEVFVYIPERFTTTAAARYWVAHRDGYTLRVVSQSANGSRWVSLGTYWFQGGNADYVSLSDVTYEPYLSRIIAFDAVRWDPR